MNRHEQSKRHRPTLRLYLLTAFALTIVCGLCDDVLAQSQWTTNGSNINNTNTGNVGIGTTTPSAKLHIVGTGELMRIQAMDSPYGGTWGYMTIYDSNGTTRYAYFGKASFLDPHFYINTENGAHLILQPYGSKVGIGTMSPNQALTVSGYYSSAFGTTAQLIGTAGSGTPQNQFNITSAANTWGLILGQNNSGAATSGYHCASCAHIVNFNNASLILGTNNTERLTITGAGNVGIGTSAPAFKLDVLGQIRSSSGGFVFPDGSVQLTAATGGGPSSTIAASYVSAGQFGANTGAGNFSFPGNIGIGVSAPAVKLAVGGAGANIYNTDAWIENNLHAQGNEVLGQGGRARLRVGTTWGYGGLFSEVSSTGAANDLVLGSSSGTVRVGPGAAAAQNFIVPNGNVGIGTASPNRKLELVGDVHGLSFEAGTASPNSGTIRFGDNTGWKLHFGRSRDSVGGALNSGTSGVLMTIQDNGNVGIGTISPSYKLDIAGQIRSSSGGFVFPDGTVQTTAASGGSGGTITGVTAGAGLTGGGISGSVTLTNADPGSSQSIFKNIANSAGATQFSAGSNNDSLRFEGSGGTNVTFDAASKKVIINSSTSGSAISATNVSAGQFGQNTGGGDFSFPANVTVAGNLAAKYQDVAEWVPSRQKLAAGTVVVLDPEQSNQVMASASAYDTRVAGVVSSAPGVILGEGGEGKVMVATTGRVKVKVDATRAPIHVGDLLVTSDVAGVAMKSEPVNLGGVRLHRPGTLIGKALEPLAKGEGEILVLLSLQ